MRVKCTKSGHVLWKSYHILIHQLYTPIVNPSTTCPCFPAPGIRSQFAPEFRLGARAAAAFNASVERRRQKALHRSWMCGAKRDGFMSFPCRFPWGKACLFSSSGSCRGFRTTADSFFITAHFSLSESEESSSSSGSISGRQPWL